MEQPSKEGSYQDQAQQQQQQHCSQIQSDTKSNISEIEKLYLEIKEGWL